MSLGSTRSMAVAQIRVVEGRDGARIGACICGAGMRHMQSALHDHCMCPYILHGSKCIIWVPFSNFTPLAEQ